VRPSIPKQETVMELLCPHCQRKLMIGDQYAGQMMKCPLCQGTFTAPALPTFPQTPDYAPPIPPTPPSPPAPPPPAPPPQIQRPAEVSPLTSSAPPEKKPLAPVPPLPQYTGDYTNRFSIPFQPDILRLVPGGALLLVFVLSFFTWVYFALGSTTVARQNAWQAAIGWVSVNKEYKDESPLQKEADRGPGISLFLLFYLPLLVITLLLAVAVPLHEILQLPLPPVVQALLQWRWLAIAALLLISFFLLVFQLALGFPMENTIRREARANLETHLKNLDNADMQPPIVDEAKARRDLEIATGTRLAGLHRSIFLDFAFWLHLIAVIGGCLMLWLDLRKHAPLPRIDVLW
jgi:hypothetical protein